MSVLERPTFLIATPSRHTTIKARQQVILHKSYQDFEISWEEPPIFSGKWSANVATENLALYGAMVTYRGGAEGAAIIEGQDREEILANARKFIDAVRSDC